MTQEFFPQVEGQIPFGGLGSSDPLAFKVYDPDRMVLGKRMEEHLRIGVCHAAVWAGLEWLRGWLFTGFGWNGLGVAFHETPVMAQAG